MLTKYEGYIWSDIEVMSIFWNPNADFKTQTRTLSSRSRSKGSTIECVWKDLVHIHMHTKYERYIWSDIEVMSIFQKSMTDSPITICPPSGHKKQKHLTSIIWRIKYHNHTNIKITSKFLELISLPNKLCLWMGVELKEKV